MSLRSHAFDSATQGREMLDAISYAGEQAQQDAVTASRLHLVRREYPSAHDFLARASGQWAWVEV